MRCRSDLSFVHCGAGGPALRVLSAVEGFTLRNVVDVRSGRPPHDLLNPAPVDRTARTSGIRRHIRGPPSAGGATMNGEGLDQADANEFSLAGQRAVITGGGRGLGAGVAASMLRAGADVVVLQRSEPAADLDRLARRLGRSVRWHELDLADADAVETVATRVLADGPVHMLVNNAGMQYRTPAVDFPLEGFDAVLQVNLRSAFQLCQLFGRPMLERGAGRIVNVASLLSFQGGITVPAYAASKGALAQLTKALSNEWAGRGVTVNAVAPGYMATELNAALIADQVRNRQISERIPIGRWGRPEDIGGAVVFLCSPAAGYVSGVVLPVDGGWLGR